MPERGCVHSGVPSAFAYTLTPSSCATKTAFCPTARENGPLFSTGTVQASAYPGTAGGGAGGAD